MEKLLEKLKSLRQRVERGERKTKSILVGNRMFIVGEDGKFVTNLKEKWNID